MKYMVVALAIAATGIGLMSCDSGSSDSSGSVADVGAAIGGLFSSSGSAQIVLAMENDTCGEFQDEEGAGGGPEGVENSASIEAGTYGATEDSVTVTADQDCESSPEDDESFASFELTADVTGSCSNGSSVTMESGSAGIWRNTATHTPEIYGTFSFTAGGETTTGIKCTIRLNGEGEVDAEESSCVDSEGDAISMTTSSTCTFN